MKNLLKR